MDQRCQGLGCGVPLHLLIKQKDMVSDAIACSTTPTQENLYHCEEL